MPSNKIRIVPTIITTFLLLSFLTLPCPSIADVPNFQDNFDESTLGSDWITEDGYAIQYPSDTINHANFNMTGTNLSISFPGDFEHNQWYLEHAQATRVYEGSGVYEIKVDSDLVNSQQFGLVFQSAPGTFIMFMLYSNSTIWGYVERFVSDGSNQTKNTVIGYDTQLLVPHTGPYYLRVIVEDDPTPSFRRWRFDYSLDGIYWKTIADEVLESDDGYSNIGIIQRVGLFAGNQPPEYSAFDARFDYYRTFPASELPISEPSDLIAVGSDEQISLSWDPVSGAEGYKVYRSLTSTDGFSLVGTVAGTNYTDSFLTNGIVYYYFVTAYADQKESQPSYEVFSTPTPPMEIEELPPDGLVLHLKVDSLPSLFNIGQQVTRWDDAYGRPVVARGQQSFAPTLEVGAHGRLVVRFDGNGQYLTLPEGFEDFADGLSIFIVARPTALQTGFKFIALGNGTGQEMVVLGRNGASSGLQYFTNDSSGNVKWFNTGDALVAGETSIFSVVQSGGMPDSMVTATVSHDGASVGSGSVYVPPIGTRAINYIGKSYWNEGFFEGDIEEIIIYDRSLSTNEVEVVNTYLNDRYESTIDPSLLLDAPDILSTISGDGVVDLSWSPVAGATGYLVYSAVTSGGPYTEIADIAGTSFSDTTVINDTTYFYVVTAYNAEQASENSLEVSATPEVELPQPLDAPNGITGTSGDGVVDLSWSPVTGATGYLVYSAATSGGPYTEIADIAGTSFSDTTVINDTTYFYVVTAYDSERLSPHSNEIIVTPVADAVLEISTNGLILHLKAENAALTYSDGDAVVSWVDASLESNHTFAAAESAPTLEVGTHGRPVVRFDGNGQYLTLPEGFEDFADGLSIFIVARPTALQTGFKFIALGNGTGQEMVVLGRNGASSGLQYFTNDSSGNVKWFNTGDALVAGETSIFSVVQSGGMPDSMVTATVSHDGASVGSGSVYVPPIGTRAINYIGKSYWNEGFFEGDIEEIIIYDRSLSTNEVEVVNTYLNDRYESTIDPSLLLDAPDILSTISGDGVVDLSWSPVAGATGYLVYSAVTSGGPYTGIADIAGTSFSDTTVINDTTYFYVVTAYNAEQASENSLEVSATPEVELPQPLDAPNGITGTSGDGVVDLSWSPVAGATGYLVYSAATSGGPYTEIADIAGTSFSDTTVINDTTYFYVVTAYDSERLSPHSNEIIVTPVADAVLEISTNGLILHLKAENAALTYSDGDAVVSWVDASLESNHTFAAAESAPTLEVGTHGRPVVRFDGNGQYLTLPEGFEDFADGLSIFIVARPTALQTGFKFIALGNGTGQEMVVLGRNGASSGLQYFTNDSSGNVKWFNTGDALVAGETSLFSVVQSGGMPDSMVTATVSHDGASVGSGSVYVPPIGTRAINYIGKSYWNEGFFEGDIEEIIIYDRSLSTNEVETIHNYLRGRGVFEVP